MTFINVFPLASIPSVRLSLASVTVTIVPSMRPGSVSGQLVQIEDRKSAAPHHITGDSMGQMLLPGPLANQVLTFPSLAAGLACARLF